jgi:hypothetical protein
MLRGPLHNRGADGLCQACGEPFPCPEGIVIFESVVHGTNVKPETVYLALTRGELATILQLLEGAVIEDHGLADRLRQVLQQSAH